MLDAIITILISLNLQFTVVDDKSVTLKDDQYKVLITSDEFIKETEDGTIHDLTVIFDEKNYSDIIITPEVDPTTKE